MVVSELALPVDLKLQMQVLGGFKLQASGGLEVKVANRKACGLLAYLALNRNTSETRERLAGLFWSDRSEEQARASLRQCLKQLRCAFEAIGFKGFTTDRQGVSLAPETFMLDLEQIALGLRNGEVAERLVNGSASPERLLYGFETLDPSFAAWLHVVRQSWHDRLLDKLQPMLSADTSVKGQIRRRAAESIISVDQTHEEAHRSLIRFHADRGNLPAALKQYNQLWDLLDQEYDMEPDGQTQSLIADIKLGTYEPADDAVNASDRLHREASLKPRLPTIEIGPFVPGDSADSRDYIAVGFRRDLVACLVRFRNWIIVEAQPATSNEMVERQQQQSTADYRIEASYVSSGENQLITVTLADARSWRYVWSERYILSFDQWAETQQKIAQRTAVALDVYLSADGLNRQIGSRDLSLETYDLWLRGQNLMLDWRAKSEAKAANLFKQVIENMPSFAPAYSSLANIYNTRHIVTAGHFRQPELEDEALRLAKKSVQLDPLETRGQLTLAWSYLMSGRYDQAEIHYELAHDLNPSDPTTLISCAHGFAFCQRTGKATNLAKQAVALHPVMPDYHWGFLVGIRFICGDYEGSVVAANRSGPAILNLPGWKTAALAQLGRTEEARHAGLEFMSFIRERWNGSRKCEDSTICEWFLHSFPIKSVETQGKLKEGLRAAGLPV